MFRRMLAIIAVLLVAIPAVAGTWTPNNFIYKPSPGARGEGEKKTFDTGLDRIDARLGKEIWVGDPLYGTTLQDAVTTIGTNKAMLRIPAGTWGIGENLTIPANITLKPERGATLSSANGVTLTINGGFEAGVYQVFSCTGTGKVVFGAGAIQEAYPEWWVGTLAGTATDATAACQAALNSLSSGQAVQLQGGTYTFAAGTTVDGGTRYNIVWPQTNNIGFKGKGKGVTKIFCNFGSDSIIYRVFRVSASSSAGIYNPTISGFTLYGPGDVTACPTTGILLGDYLYNVVTSDLEIYYFRGSGIRSSSANQGAVWEISHNYIHDCCTANMPGSIYDAGDAGAIKGAIPHTTIKYNRIVNVGAGATEVGLYHAVYSGNENLVVEHNYAEGPYSDIDVGTSDTVYNNVTVSNNVSNGDCIIVVNFNNATVAGNVVQENYLRMMNCTNFSVTGNSVYTPTKTSSPSSRLPLFYLTNSANGTVTGNRLYGNGLEGYAAIQLDGASNILFDGNSTSNTSEGIYFYNGTNTDITINNNRFVGTGSSGNYRHGVYFAGAESGDHDNIHIDNNYFEAFKYMITSHYSATTTTNIIARNNILKNVLQLISFSLDPSGPFYLDNNMSLDTVLAYNMSTISPGTSPTIVGYVNNTWRLPDTKTSTLANSATPSIAFGNVFKSGGTTTITNLTKGTVGQTITILAAHSVTITHNANANDGYMLLNAHANFAMAAGDTLTLHMFAQGIWQETGRKLN